MYRRRGPFASVYLSTDRSYEGWAHVVPRRWARLRARLGESGAPCGVLGPLGDLLLNPAEAAPGRAAFAEGGDIVLTEPLPRPPRRETARWSLLPHVVPLLAQRGERVPHLQVLADRLGADVIIMVDGPRRELVVEGAPWPPPKVNERDVSDPRYERDLEETWRRNAAAVAEVVDKEAHGAGAEVIVLAGDPKARGLILEHLAKDTARRVTVAEHGSRAPGAVLNRFQAEVEQALAAWADRRRAELLDAYAAGVSVAGLQETARALRDARVQTVLLRDDPSSVAMMWIGPEACQLSTDQDELAAWGADRPVPERADAALARAIAATDAELWFVDAIDSPDGVGAVLRF
jgi:hypothetical protein